MCQKRDGFFVCMCVCVWAGGCMYLSTSAGVIEHSRERYGLRTT